MLRGLDPFESPRDDVVRAAMKKPPKNQRATHKHGADESAELFRAATKAGGESKPKVDKKLAKAFREDDPTQDDHSKSKKIPRSFA
jgi:hypothetical protein